MPGDTPRPGNRCSVGTGCSFVSETCSLLIKLAFDQIGECGHRRFGLAPGADQLDDRAWRRRQHHQPHDRAAGNLGAVFAHRDLGVELRCGFDKTGGRTRVEPTLVANRHDPARRARLVDRAGAHRRASLSSCEATLMYLRPASWAPSTVRSRLSVCRRLASLISIGRLTPAITSILARSMTEIARFDGVPPNMSVNKTTPSPLSTSAIDCRISWRRCSMSSSGPMQTAAICVCAPTTCSRAAANSAARRPWVTRTT